MTHHELQLNAVALRRTMLRLIFNAGAGHTGGGLSCMDILNVLYNRAAGFSNAPDYWYGAVNVSLIVPFGR